MVKLKQRTMAHAAAIVLSMNLLNAHAAHALTPPAQASYLNANGAVAIMGDDAMRGIVQNLDASFARDYPSFRFVLETKGASTALPALTADVSALAPITRDAFDGERAGFRQVHGRDPVVIRVGYVVERPAVVIVNRRNAIGGLTITQLMQVFTSGAPQGDINFWSQLGDARMPAECRDRRIHLYGRRDDGTVATTTRRVKFGNHPFAATYETFDNADAVAQAVSEDVCGIGLIGADEQVNWPQTVRPLALGTEAGKYAPPTIDGIASGRYPLASHAQFYVYRAEGRPLEPWIKAYFSEALSDEAQSMISVQKGFAPLSAADLKRERERLAGM
ncbi:PstS family phosphate ABC transporter substrate-binding protein [Caballeronia sp. TF1N1]|uniref:PstS family phosphate ABC transporter substrate-binding protein n=1 Tax=Caballeronia sp. TF1N1 TaxID=2878153 RepID=UPI001FD234F3|nr:substrate-binding domain-containing protein [Caballeronia sp. TF1N1]